MKIPFALRCVIAANLSVLAGTAYAEPEWDPWVKAVVSSQDVAHRPGGNTLEQDSWLIESRIGVSDELRSNFTWFVDARAVVSSGNTTLIDPNTEFAQDDGDGENYFLQLREAYVRYHGFTRLPDEHLTLGLQRIDDVDGFWLDADVESLVWRGETTQLDWQIGVGKEFDTYRTDADLLAINDDVTRLFANVDWDWIAYHSIGVAYLSQTQSTGLSTNTFAQTSLGYNAESTWVGLRLMSNWDEKRSPQMLAYKAEWIQQSGDTSVVELDGSLSPKDINADALDLGIRLDTGAWSFGVTHTRGSGGATEQETQNFSQSGLHSNRGHYFGVRQRLYRFNEALRADVTNLKHTGLFVSYQPNEFWETVLLVGDYKKDDSAQDVYSFGREIETIAGNDDVGSSIDLNITHYARDTNPFNLNLVRLRAGTFSPGDAFVDQSRDYRVTLEAQFRF